jgi:tol-pal system protein YbgF
MGSRIWKKLAGMAMAVLLVGCVTEGDFQRLQGETRRDLAQQNQQIRDLSQRVGDLQGDRAKGSRQLADQSNDLTAMQREVSALRGQVDTLSQRGVGQMRQELDALRKAVEQMGGAVTPSGPAPGPGPGPGPVTPTAPPAPSPERAEDLYKTAMFRFEEGDNPKAREGFQTVLTRHPDSQLADNAQFWIGECYFREGNFKQAILEYEKVISQYPKSAKIPAALLKQGMAFEKLGDMESARYLYSKVTKDYPETDQARMADHRLKNIP